MTEKELKKLETLEKCTTENQGLIKDGWKILIRHDDMEQRQTERLHHFDYTEDDKYIVETMIYDETIDECRQRLDYEKAHALKLSVVDFEGGLYEVFGKDFNDICELASERYADKIDPKNPYKDRNKMREI